MPRNRIGSISRVAITSSVIAVMKTMPSQIATKPALRVPALSRRPTAWPTRTVAAIEIPNGTMNRIEAMVSAI